MIEKLLRETETSADFDLIKPTLDKLNWKIKQG